MSTRLTKILDQLERGTLRLECTCGPGNTMECQILCGKRKDLLFGQLKNELKNVIIQAEALQRARRVG